VLPCIGGDRWYPLTGLTGFVHAPVRKVREAVHPFTSRSARVAQFPDLDTALAGAGPFPLARNRTTFLLPCGGGEWTAVLTSAAPGGDVRQYLAARAALDLRCDLVALEWTPRAPGVVAVGAAFTDYRHERRGLFGSSSSKDWHRRTRTVHVSQQERDWTFDAIGPVRDFEEPAAYAATRKAERLDLALLTRYAQAAGIPVGDTGWLDGPVHTATSAPRADTDDVPTWSTVAELRALCGYAPSGLPEQL
jgi:hypothetical protein